MKLITSGEVRNRVDQLMNDKFRVCKVVTLTFRVTLIGAHGLPQSLPWCHHQRQTTINLMASCSAEDKAKPLNMSTWSLILEDKTRLMR